MSKQNPMPYFLFVVLALPGIYLLYLGFGEGYQVVPALAGLVWFVAAALVASSLRIADQWERAVVLRLGKFTNLRGSGPVLHFSCYRQGGVLDR
ncbi:MAG: hypothetical protein WCB46_06185 [Methanoregula sp.]